MTVDPKKKERLAAALRENLKRRKARERTLKGGMATEGRQDPKSAQADPGPKPEGR